MKIIGIEHIGIAVKSIDKRSPFWEHVLGIKSTGREKVLDEGVETGIYDIGGGKIELLESVKSDSAIQKFMDKKGEGIHHVCLKVDDVYNAIAELKEKGISVIYQKPKKGAEGFLVTFIHPRDSGGVLVELAQET
jgi:methylmalonyl-CoA epimerase|tara:strand:- start:1290 stop:1694 length:405 start_codon:yes stop_codon:yes gene_type:complete